MTTKEAAGFASHAKGFGKQLGDGVRGGLATAIAGTAVAALGGGAAAIYDAATKHRDFKQMLEHNPDLHQFHAEKPKQLNAFFSSLRSVNPGFSKDPIIAGAYLRRMTETGSPGGVAAEAAQLRDRFPNQLGEAFRTGATEGARAFGVEALKGRNDMRRTSMQMGGQQAEGARGRDFQREMAAHGLDAELHREGVSHANRVGLASAHGAFEAMGKPGHKDFDATVENIQDTIGGHNIPPKPGFGLPLSQRLGLK